MKIRQFRRKPTKLPHEINPDEITDSILSAPTKKIYFRRLWLKPTKIHVGSHVIYSNFAGHVSPTKLSYFVGHGADEIRLVSSV